MRKFDSHERGPQKMRLAQDRSRQGNSHTARDSTRESKGSNRGRESRVVHKEPPKPRPTVAMPSFLTAGSGASREEPESFGFGTGFAERKTLEYGERYEPEPEFVKQPEPPVKKPEPAVERSEPIVTPSEPITEPSEPPVRHFEPTAKEKEFEDVPNAKSTPAFGMDEDIEPYKAKTPTPAFGVDADTESYKPARSKTESIHDILDVDTGFASPPSAVAYRPEFERDDRQVSRRAQPRAQLFNPGEFRFNPSQNDSQTQDNWGNLRRRQSEPVPPPTFEDFGSAVDEQDDSWIDRRFAEHQQERETRARAISTPPRVSRVQQRRQQVQQNDPFSDSFNDRNLEVDTSARTCGRCGQKGHVARQCTQAASRYTKCHSCGEMGHTANHCPSYLQRLEINNQNASRDGGGERDYIVDPRQEMMSRMQSKFAVQQPEEEEQPAERTLKSRKFRDDEPRKEKPSRRSRRDDDDDYDDRRSRRDREYEEDEQDDRRSRKASKKEAKDAERKAQRAAERAAQQAELKNQIKLPEFISVQNLAQALGVRYEQFVNRLEDLGYEDIFPGKIFNTEVSGMIAMEYEMEPVFDSSIREEEERDLKARPEVDEQDKDLLPTRPPVVTIMGHVDHGKTTILDYLRKSSVAAGEAGGITQHIGAFSVPLTASGKTVTFLDTPGHAAFLAMRQRGANVTDIVILVVAADDSVKPQTLEAIKHAKGAGVPMLVAINKCDKDSADVQRVKQDLARHGVEIEDFGGDTQVVEVSGKTGQGMDELEEAAVTLSEILDHRADTDGAVEGWVLEATTKKAGRVATVLVRRGTLKQGAVIVAGNTWARVRSLHNEAGVAIDEAGPGMPVEVDGWRDQPAAGDEVLQAPTEQKATSVVEYRLEKIEREKTAEDMEVINENRRIEAEKREREKVAAQQAKQRENSEDGEIADAAPVQPTATTGGRMEIPFLIKADVSGSAEAVEAYIMSVSSPMIAPRILSSSVGPVHESDVELAATTQGHIIAFNLPSNEGLQALATTKGVRVLENNIIYRVLDDVKAVLEEKLPPIITQRVLGEAEIGAAFEIGVGGRRKVKIAGCKIRNGVVGNGTRVRVMRGEEKVYDGTISSLKNVKKDVQEMRKGSECGMGFDGWEAFEVGDQIQTYEEKSEKRTL